MATPQRAPMKLTQEPEIVTWPEMHYIFIEKIGPFQDTAGQAWQELAAEPKNLPEKLTYEKFKGGKYSRFVLTGSYSNLPEASGRVFEIVAEKKIQVRDDFYIENYANDPRTTPEDQLVTEILIPTV